MSRPLLVFERVSFRYQLRQAPVLENFSLEIRPGTVTAILGPNGVGKTTLLYLALGWLRPDAGRVLLAGKALSQYSRRELGRWQGLVPQSEHIPFEYSLLEVVLLGRAPHLMPLEMPGEVDCRKAERALERVGLGGMSSRHVTTLSGGERQLVLIARALAQEPRLLLLDEPTAHLDLSNKSRLLGLLHQLAEQGVTILMTTHEPEVAAAVASEVVLMRQGQVQVHGPLAEVLTGERLSQTFGVPVQVVALDGRQVVLWEPSLQGLAGAAPNKVKTGYDD